MTEAEAIIELCNQRQLRVEEAEELLIDASEQLAQDGPYTVEDCLALCLNGLVRN